MYMRLYELFSSSCNFSKFDAFKSQKDGTFEKSSKAASEIALRYTEITKDLKNKTEKDSEVLFIEFLEISLWGNAADLSLLTNLSHDDIERLHGTNAQGKFS